MSFFASNFAESGTTALILSTVVGTTPRFSVPTSPILVPRPHSQYSCRRHLSTNFADLVPNPHSQSRRYPRPVPQPRFSASQVQNPHFPVSLPSAGGYSSVPRAGPHPPPSQYSCFSVPKAASQYNRPVPQIPSVFGGGIPSVFGGGVQPGTPTSSAKTMKTNMSE